MDRYILGAPTLFENMRIGLAASAALLLVSHAAAQTQSGLDVMPMPASVRPGTGRLAVGPSFSVAVTGFKDAALERGIDRFVAELSRETGMLIEQNAAGSAGPTLLIHAGHRRESVQELGEDESYELVVAESGAKLTAPSFLGVLYGLQTFLQLVETTANGFSVPAVTIDDKPQFVWRGLLIDVGRHFIPLEVLKRNVDGMAAVKMNVRRLVLHAKRDSRVRGLRARSRHPHSP